MKDSKITFAMLRKMKLAVTHAGTMHLDDIMCGALLLRFFPNISEIHRLNDKQLIDGGYLHEDENVLVFDIGRGAYDHHGKECEQFRPNGVKYASIGLLWRDIGYECVRDAFNQLFDFSNKVDKINASKYIVPGVLIDDATAICVRAAEILDEKLIQSIDQTDNFGQVKYPSPLAFIMSGYDDYDVATTAMSTLLNGAINAAITSAVAEFKMKYVTEHIPPEQTVVVVDQFGVGHIPSIAFRGAGDVKFLVCKSLRNEGHYVLNSVDSEQWPINLPENTPGLTFVHQMKFTADFKSFDHLRTAVCENHLCGVTWETFPDPFTETGV